MLRYSSVADLDQRLRRASPDEKIPPSHDSPHIISDSLKEEGLSIGFTFPALLRRGRIGDERAKVVVDIDGIEEAWRVRFRGLFRGDRGKLKTGYRSGLGFGRWLLRLHALQA